MASSGLSAFLPTLFDLTKTPEDEETPPGQDVEESAAVIVKKEEEEGDYEEDEEEEDVANNIQDQPTENQTENVVEREEDNEQEEVERGVNEKTTQPVVTRGTQSSTWDQLATELVLEVVTQQVTKVRGLQTTAPGAAGCVHLDGMAWKDIVQMIVETHNKKCAHTGVTLNHHMVGMTSSITGDDSADKPKKVPEVKKPDGRALANRGPNSPRPGPKPTPARGRVKMRGGKVNSTGRVKTLLPNNRSNNLGEDKSNNLKNFEAEFQATVQKILTGEVDDPDSSKTDNHVEKTAPMETNEQVGDGTQMNDGTQATGDDEDDIDIVQCRDCRRWFQSGDQLKRHSVVHATNRGPHICEVCKSKFPTEWDLQNHMPAAHKDIMPEPDVDDSPVRVVKRGRKRKIKTEVDEYGDASNEEIFECETCNSLFKTAGGLKKHRTMIHRTTIIQVDKQGKILGRPEVQNTPGPLSREMNMMNIGGNWNKCQVCKEVFRSKMQLDKHMSIHSVGNGDHKCDECGKSCRTEWNLSRHMMIHSKIKKHKCPDCDASFGIKANYERHRARVHNAGETYSCDVDGCGAKYKNKVTLKYHMLEHSGEKNFACNFCNASFPRPDALRLHKMQHKPKKFNCTLCNKAYPYRSLLVRHWQNSHWKEETIKCKYCDKVFQNYYQKNAHEFEIHTGKRLYSCGTCGKGFHQKSSLALHDKSHTGEKPWVCDICTKQFVTRSHMLRHKKVHDSSNRKQYQCSFCDSEFVYKNQWLDHENRHQGIKPHECSQCQARFVARCDLSRHMKVHTGRMIFSCAYCDMTFKQKASMEKHEMTKHLQFDSDEDDTNNVVIFKLKK